MTTIISPVSREGELLSRTKVIIELGKDQLIEILSADPSIRALKSHIFIVGSVPFNTGNTILEKPMVIEMTFVKWEKRYLAFYTKLSKSWYDVLFGEWLVTNLKNLMIGAKVPQGCGLDWVFSEEDYSTKIMDNHHKNLEAAGMPISVDRADPVEQHLKEQQEAGMFISMDLTALDDAHNIDKHLAFGINYGTPIYPLDVIPDRTLYDKEKADPVGTLSQAISDYLYSKHKEEHSLNMAITEAEVPKVEKDNTVLLIAPGMGKPFNLESSGELIIKRAKEVVISEYITEEFKDTIVPKPIVKPQVHDKKQRHQNNSTSMGAAKKFMLRRR